MMFWHFWARTRRGDSLWILAAFLTLALVPNVAGASFAPQNAAVLLLLGADSQAQIEAEPPAPRAPKSQRNAAWTPPHPLPKPQLAPLERHEVARLNGVRTNIRRN